MPFRRLPEARYSHHRGQGTHATVFRDAFGLSEEQVGISIESVIAPGVKLEFYVDGEVELVKGKKHIWLCLVEGGSNFAVDQVQIALSAAFRMLSNEMEFWKTIWYVQSAGEVQRDMLGYFN